MGTREQELGVVIPEQDVPAQSDGRGPAALALHDLDIEPEIIETALAVDEAFDDVTSVEGTITEQDQFYVDRADVRAKNAARRAARLSGKGPKVSRHRRSSEDSFGLYLNEMGETPLLTKEQEAELSQKVHAGQSVQARLDNGEKVHNAGAVLAEAAEAKNLFIKSNLRLVVSIARRFPLPQGMALGDLVQEGNLGLEHAVDKFEHERGFKFSTYATFWIRQSIGRALDQKSHLIRLPGERSSQLRAAMRNTGGDMHALDTENSELYRLVTPISYDSPAGDDSGTTLGDLLPDQRYDPEVAVMESAESIALMNALDMLSPKTAHAIKGRYGMNTGEQQSFREIGDEIGVTAEATRRMIGRGIDEIVRTSPQLKNLLDRYAD